MITRLIVSIFLLVSFTASAQKTKYIGDYLLGKAAGDTLSGRLFVSLDSFKFIYQVSIKNKLDYAYTVLPGAWDIGSNNEITFRFKNGAKETGMLKLQEFSGNYFLRITIVNKVFTRTPTVEQIQEMHH